MGFNSIRFMLASINDWLGIVWICVGLEVGQIAVVLGILYF
jgi:hypothetical protein